jgi:hypothetical protein
VKAGRIGVDRCNRDRAIWRWLSSHDIRQQQPCDGKGEYLAHLLSLARFKAIAVGTVTNKLVYVAYGLGGGWSWQPFAFCAYRFVSEFQPL